MTPISGVNGAFVRVPANPEAMLLASKEATGEIPQSELDELDAIMAKAHGGRAFINSDVSGVASIIRTPDTESVPDR